MLTLLLQIISIVTSVLSADGGVVGNDAQIAAALVKIAQAANATYTAQTGQPMDPSLIVPETPL